MSNDNALHPVELDADDPDKISGAIVPVGLAEGVSFVGSAGEIVTKTVPCFGTVVELADHGQVVG
jgi:hypothetical protein